MLRYRDVSVDRDMKQVFPRTIIEVARRIEKLEREIRLLYEQGNEAYSGGDTWHSAGFRFLEQHRIAQEETLRVLKQLQKRAQVINVPEGTSKVALGHEVTIEFLDAGVSQKLHICSSDDASILTGVCETSEGRLLSIETKLGKRLLGRQKGDIVTQGSQRALIKEIAVSRLVLDTDEE